MFRVTMCPSPGETTACMRHLVLVILCGWLVCRVEFHSTLHTRQTSTQNNKYQVSHKHSCFSWWWAHSHPKHVEIDKYTKNKLCTKLALFTRFILNLSTKWCLSAQLQAHATQNQPAYSGKEKNLFPLLGFKQFLGWLAHSHSLYWVHYTYSM